MIFLLHLTCSLLRYVSYQVSLQYLYYLDQVCTDAIQMLAYNRAHYNSYYFFFA